MDTFIIENIVDYAGIKHSREVGSLFHNNQDIIDQIYMVYPHFDMKEALIRIYHNAKILSSLSTTFSHDLFMYIRDIPNVLYYSLQQDGDSISLDIEYKEENTCSLLQQRFSYIGSPICIDGGTNGYQYYRFIFSLEKEENVIENTRCIMKCILNAQDEDRSTTSIVVNY